MNIEWKKNFKPEHVLKELDKAKRVNEDNVSFVGYEGNGYVLVIQDSIHFPKIYTGISKNEIIWEAIKKIAKNETLNKDNIIREVKSLAESAKKSELKEYHLLSSLSISYPSIRKLSVLDAEVRFYSKNFPHKFNSRSDFIEKKLYKSPDTRSNYCNVVITVKSKSTSAAYLSAIQVLDLIRGIWCLHCNDYLIYEWSCNPSPINKILIGEVQTIHGSNGSALQLYGMQPNFKPQEIFAILKASEIFCKKTLRSLAQSAYKEKLIDALCSYVNALDYVDYSVSLMRLWSALEIFLLKKDEKSDKIISRVRNIYQTKPYIAQSLEAIRDIRNNYVHNSVENKNAKDYCYQLQEILRKLFSIHMYNTKKFGSFDDAMYYLDLSLNHDTLNKQFALIKTAINRKKRAPMC